MSGRVVFLLEEPSMQVLLGELLPRLFPGWIEEQHFLCVPHEGKGDLDRSIPRKLAAWRVPGDRFVIVRDTDGADCVDLKRRLVDACTASGRPDSMVRLVCQELEAWYLGDLQALADEYAEPALAARSRQARFRDPDAIVKPSHELARLIPDFGKRAGARAMGARLDPDRNTSRSFGHFVSGLRRLVAKM